jgi:Endonuclease/Exonuclease/phosphatase family
MINYMYFQEMISVNRMFLLVGWLNAQSMINKTIAIGDVIADKRLDVLAVTETWHRSTDYICLRLATPSGYTSVDAVRDSDPGHGGIVLFHRNTYVCTKIALARMTSFEGLCVQIAVNGQSFIFLTIVRPGSARPSSLFFDELTAVIETLVLQPCPVVVGGDFNIHIETPTDPDAVRLFDLVERFDMIQHVDRPTHRLGCTLDLIATFSDYRVTDICIDPAGIVSDHGLIMCRLPSISRCSDIVCLRGRVG